MGNVIELSKVRAAGAPEEAGGAPKPASSGPGPRARPREKRIISVGGGKGGIGKTMVSANLGIALAQAGNRVLLVDVDLGGANLHTALGVGPSKATLSDLIEQKAQSIEQVMVGTGVEGLKLISGANDVLDAANMKYQHKLKLLRHLQSADVDYVILDLGAGTSFNTLDFFLVADHGILVLLPEPTSVENAYRFIKAAFFRRLQNAAEHYGISELVNRTLSTRGGASRTPFDFVAEVKTQNAEVGDKLLEELKSFRAKLVVNQARTPADLNVGAAVASAWKKFFGLEIEVLGAISYDDEAWRAVRKRRPLLLERPDSAAGRSLTSLANRLLELDQPPQAPDTR